MARRLVVVGMVVSLFAGGCSPSAPAAAGSADGPSEPVGSTAGAPSATGLPSAPPMPITEDATYLAAAEAELALRHQLREDARVAEVIGPDGLAVLAATDELETDFGERAMAEFVARRTST